jgi:monoamine oxidase
MERLTRRHALGRGGALAGVVAGGALLSACADSAGTDTPRVVVVGAGLAGLTCAHRLRQAGIAADVFEAQQRVGGRCWSTRSVVPGLVGEHGGEFIDTGHARIRALADELGLELEDRLAAAESAGGRDAVLLGGRRRSQAALTAGFDALAARLDAEAQRIGSYRAGAATPAARALDERSAADWIAANVPGGSRSPLGRAVEADLTGAFGLDPDRLSAITLLQAYTGPDTGPAERFHVRGGNDQIPRMLAAGLPERALRVGSAMQGLRRRAPGDYEMLMDRYRKPVRADVIVLAQPLANLRDADLGDAGLPAPYRRMIDAVAMGTNAKLLLGLRERPQAFDGWSGELLSDAPVMLSWDAALGQDPQGEAGLLALFTGGRTALDLPGTAPHAPPPASLVRDAVERLEQVAPGVGAALSGRAWLDAWHRDRWAGGSYAAFGPGQVTAFWGLLRRPVGGIVFAGEHTSTSAQGYMEGAVESGERAARQVAAILRRGR